MAVIHINKLGVSIALATLWMFASCSEIRFGDNFLGDAPESSGSTLETMFSSKINAEEVLTKAYTGLPYGLPYSCDNRLGGNILETLTDLAHSYRNNGSDSPFQQYYGGAIDANTIGGNSPYLFGSETDWQTIKYSWIYIANVDNVPDMTTSEKESKKAEAKVLIALSYFNMLRYVGGVAWLDHSVEINEPMHFPRITFAQTVENIRNLLDEAIPLLPWKWDDNNDGRMSMAGAMALKFKLLQWAASPTFNSDTKWHPQADEYTCYGNYDPQRWKDAADAGKAFFDELDNRGQYGLILASEPAPTHDAYRKAYRKAYYERGGTEILISFRKGTNSNICQDYYNSRLYSGPTLNYVNMFPWSDGTDFPEDFNWKNPDRQPFFENITSGPTRDPRLYENVAVPGDIYFNGVLAPCFEGNESYRKGETTGFLTMKFILQNTTDRNVFPQWPHTRLSEIMLGYAEVLNEVNNGPTQEAYDMINAVRARVGLSKLENMSKSDFYEAVLRERALELGFEEVRWFDLVRCNRSQDFVKPLYGLLTVGDNSNAPTSFTFEPFPLPERAWSKNWDSKWYLMPIPQTEINKKYGMTQNPGW